MPNPLGRPWPRAYHVFPLHRARELWHSGHVLGKADLRDRYGELAFRDVTRSTSRDADRVLGFSGQTHWYLARGSNVLGTLPILRAQLDPSPMPARPHAVLELDVNRLERREIRLCNWNIAVSRPKVDGRCKGGNWTRGTRVERVAEVWDWFRELLPPEQRSRETIERRRGFWLDGFRVPLLAGDHLPQYLPLLRKAAGGFPELLLESPWPIARCRRAVVFSEEDRRSIELAGSPPGELPIEVHRFPGYDGSIGEWSRRDIDRHLRGETNANIAFDAIRPRMRGRSR